MNKLLGDVRRKTIHGDANPEVSLDVPDIFYLGVCNERVLANICALTYRPRSMTSKKKGRLLAGLFGFLWMQMSRWLRRVLVAVSITLNPAGSSTTVRHP
jgi:hypothetical protein